jgi:hypothetical protein
MQRGFFSNNFIHPPIRDRARPLAEPRGASADSTLAARAGEGIRAGLLGGCDALYRLPCPRTADTQTILLDSAPHPYRSLSCLQQAPLRLPTKFGVCNRWPYKYKNEFLYGPKKKV